MLILVVREKWPHYSGGLCRRWCSTFVVSGKVVSYILYVISREITLYIGGQWKNCLTLVDSREN